MTDTNVQVRAGQNVGNEPAGINFVEKAGSIHTVIPTTGDRVTLVEGVERAIRSLNNQTNAAGKLVNTSGVDTVNVILSFEDAEGNEMDLGAAIPVSPGGVGDLSGLGSLFVCLAAGEKINARAAVEEGD